MNTHLNDIISLPAKGIPKVKHVEVLVSCELMNSHSKAWPIEPTDQLLITQDQQGHVMLFDIDSKGVFHLFHYKDGMAGGYAAYELVKGLYDYDRVVTFDLSENRDGTISIAMALARRGSSYTDIFVAENIPTAYDWKNFFQKAKKVNGINAYFEVRNIRIGTTDMNKHALVVLDGHIGGNIVYYQVSDTAQSAIQLDVPGWPQNMIQVEVGYAFGQKANFFLYKLGDTNSLVCITIPDQSGGSYTYDFSTSNIPVATPYLNLHYNCMFITQGAPTDPKMMSSDLYVGTAEGIFFFQGCKINQFQRVNDKVKDIQELYVTEDAKRISVWAITKSGNLYYISGTKNGDTYTWDEEELFDKKIAHLSTIRNKVKFTNEIYYVDKNRNFVHNWECPTSGFWFTRTIKQENDPYLLEVPSYTTLIKLTDQDGNILAGQSFSLASSEWLYVEINGETYNMDVDHPVTVKTDNRGFISIVQFTDEVLAPIFYLNANFIDKTINIFPHGKVIQGLSKIQTADDLRNAKDANGDSILTGYHPPATINNVVDCLRTLTGVAAYAKIGAVRKGDLFVSLTNNGTRETGKLHLQDIPDFKIGIKLERGTWQLFTESDYLKAVHDSHLARGFFKNLWRAVKKVAEDVVDAVTTIIEKVGSTLKLIINIAGDVYHFVLDTLSEVMKGIDWVLSLVKIAIGDALRWLGNILGFNDVWRTYKIISMLLKNGITYSADAVEKRLSDLQQFLNEEFGKIESLVFNAPLPSNIASQSLNKVKSIHNPFDSAAGNWIFSLIANNQLFEGGSSASVGTRQFQNFVNNTVKPAIEGIIPQLNVLFEDLSHALSKDVKYFHAIIKDLIKLFIVPMKKVMMGIIDFVKEMVQSIPSLMNGKVLPPFLSALYRRIASLFGDNEDLTILNAVSFIIAIPYTYGHRIVTGEAPFALGDAGLSSPNLFKTLFDGHRSSLPLNVLDDLKKTYSQGGAAIASIASMPLALLSLATSMGRSSRVSELDQLVRGFEIVIPLLTIPIEKDHQNTTAYRLRITAFVYATMKDWFGGRIDNLEMRNVITAVTDTFIFALSLTADIYNKEDFLSYFQDILSNLGGVVRSGGELSDEVIAVGIGAGISLGGSAVGLVQAVSAGGDIVQIVNPGG